MRRELRLPVSARDEVDIEDFGVEGIEIEKAILVRIWWVLGLRDG